MGAIYFNKVRIFVLSCLLFSACQAPVDIGSFNESSPEHCRREEVPNQYLVQWADGSIDEVSYRNKVELEQELNNQFPNAVDFVEPVYRVIRPDQSRDPFTIPESFASDWATDEIGAQYAWRRGFFGDGVVVAVVDTGVDLNHPQLQGRFYINEPEDPERGGQPGVDDDGNGYIDDISGWNFVDRSNQVIDETGHGTHVAGIIAADPDYGPIQGVAPRAKILPIDFMDERGGTSSHAIEAIDYAIKKGAQIINASWTTPDCSRALMRAFLRWEKLGVFFVSAAGNSRKNLNELPEYPPSFFLENQITVGAVDYRGVQTEFTNYGRAVQIFAPGEFIHSIEPNSISTAGVGYRRGTSMSAAFVSGQAAILLSLEPSLSPKQIRNLIIETAGYGRSRNAKGGRIRIDRSLHYLGY